MIKRTLILSLILLSNSLFANSQAIVNQTSVYEGDPVTLILETDNNKAAPNLKPLQTDFNILGKSTSSQVNINNGRRSFKKIWTVELQPKLSGKIKIPSIQIGKDQTSQLEINITKLPPEVAKETNKHIFIEATVDIENDETYVQQQIPYMVKLFYDSSMQSGEVFTPKIDDANIRSLGKDRKYQVVRAGKKFTLIEKHFVISPEKSGKLVIPSTTVKGRIALAGGDSPRLRQRMDETDILNRFFNNFKNDPFFSSPFDELFSRRSIGPSRPFSITSEVFNINVLPVPKSFTGKAWLPAEDLIMEDSWGKQPPEFKVGEPATRTLLLQVKGLASSQIPEIEIPKPAGIKIYPEKAVTETPTDGNTVYSIQRIEISYIPSATGKVTIPEIAIDWWDVKNKEQKTFTLPEWNLSVAAGIAGNNLPLIGSEPMSDANPDINKSISNRKIATTSSNWMWKAVFIIVFLSLLAGLILFTFRYKLFKTIAKSDKNARSLQLVDLNALRASLLEASKNNDKQLAAKLLLKYVRTKWNDQGIHNLGALAAQLNYGTDTIRELEQSLYATTSIQWKGQELTELVNKGLFKKQINRTVNSKYLEPLYPS